MGERADIYEMGLICYQLGLTPANVQEYVGMGANCLHRGLTPADLVDLWRIKLRAIDGYDSIDNEYADEVFIDTNKIPLSDYSGGNDFTN